MLRTIPLFLLCFAALLWSCGSKNSNVNSTASNQLSSEEYLILANDLNNSGNLDSALSVLNIVLTQDSQSFDAQLLRADVYFALGNYQESMKGYKACLEEKPKSSQLWTRLGKIYLNQKDKTAALKYFTQAINFDPSYADAYIGRAIVFGKQEDMEQAYLSMQTAIDFDPNNLNALLTMASWKLADSLEIATQYLTNAIRVDSTVADHYFRRARAFEKFANYQSAEKDYLKALALDSNNINYAFSVAYFYYQFENWNQSLKYFTKCLDINPNDVDALLGRALSLKKLDRLKDAEQTLNQLLQIAPNDAEAQRELENLR